MFLGCVYIPPENAQHASESCFTEIYNDIIHFSQKSKFAALVGDFNAGTAKLSDCIIPDENVLHDILDITDDKMNVNMYTYHILEQLNIPPERNNEDEGRTNPYGMKLLDLCRRCLLFIPNSRLLNDKYIGRTTCKDISTVDYLIMYSLLFQYVN